MAMKPKTPCAQPGCAALCHSTYCDAYRHRRDRRYDRDRGSSSARDYGAWWRKLREYVLQRHPVCRMESCTAATTDVDHITPKRRGGTDDLKNHQALWHAHHSEKTAREDSRWG